MTHNFIKIRKLALIINHFYLSLTKTINLLFMLNYVTELVVFDYD